MNPFEDSADAYSDPMLLYSKSIVTTTVWHWPEPPNRPLGQSRNHLDLDEVHRSPTEKRDTHNGGWRMTADHHLDAGIQGIFISTMSVELT